MGSIGEISSVEYLFAAQRVARDTANEMEKEDENDKIRLQARIKKRSDEKLRRLSELEATKISIIASMVPDEILYQPSDYSVREFDAALMMIDVSGFTELCETYTKSGQGGPSKLTQVLNSYIGSMVQEILTQNGDVYKFSGDAFLSIWKSSDRLSMQDVVHAAIDCALLIQKNYGSQTTDAGVNLKVKVAISAGRTLFLIIGDDTAATYVIVGQPVWDCKKAEKVCEAGDVITATCAWEYVNEAEYWIQHLADGVHTRVMGVGVTWNSAGQGVLHYNPFKYLISSQTTLEHKNSISDDRHDWDDESNAYSHHLSYHEYSLRPSVLNAFHGSWWQSLRRFMLSPVLHAMDNDEPMDHLSEVRRVVLMFLNIVNVPTSEVDLLQKTDKAFRIVARSVSHFGGLLNKINLFDKDIMLLAVFGLRGLKQVDEANKALRCAMELRESLVMEKSFRVVSIGVTSGSTYCGVVGHTLRREYTVIGAAVNKAARLITNYPNKVTCDTETFLSSNISPEYFALQDARPLKGIAKPGPIYEYLKNKTTMQWSNTHSYQILGRASELRMYRETLMAAIHQNKLRSTLSEHKFGIVIKGAAMVGKTRFADECLRITPDYVPTIRLTLVLEDTLEFGLIRKIFTNYFGLTDANRATVEYKIKTRIQMDGMSPLEVHAVNVIFNCRFPLPERFSYSGDLLSEYRVKKLIWNMCYSCFEKLCLCAIDGGHFIDNSSWRVLLLMMETDTILFLIIVRSDLDKLSNVARRCLQSERFIKVALSSIDRIYHAALICQALGVRGIPAALEKVIQCTIGGKPGWIHNYVITLMQSGWLKIESVSRAEALASGAVLPSRQFLDTNAPSRASVGHGWDLFSTSFEESFESLPRGESSSGESGRDFIKVAVLDAGYNCSLDADDSVNAVILKTYDSLTSFEKMLVKCGSVLGDVFTRRMVEQLLRGSTNSLAQAVQKLFEVDVLICEGGDFSRITSVVLVYPAPSPAQSVRTGHYCFCRGVEPQDNEQQLPAYAFCGYMRFKNPLFRSTTYDLLTENQKLDFHLRALMFLEKHLHRCNACGGGCFARIVGYRAENDLARKSSRLKETKKKIDILCGDAMKLRDKDYNTVLLHYKRKSEEFQVFLPRISNKGSALQSLESSLIESSELQESEGFQADETSIFQARVPSNDMTDCECLQILSAVYPQLIRHCRGTEQWDKMVEAYLEFAFINILCSYVPHALQLLLQVEDFVLHNIKYGIGEGWQRKVMEGRILSLRGECMLELGDLVTAEQCLLGAMKTYGCRFPSSSRFVRLYSVQASIKQTLMLSLPALTVGTKSGKSGDCYDHIADTLNHLHRLFVEKNEPQKAELAAKCSMNMAWCTNTNFRLLCESYANMINLYCSNKDMNRCAELVQLCGILCYKRNRSWVEVTELRALTSLYTAIFCYYLTSGKIKASIELSLSTLHLITDLTDPSTSHLMLLGLLNLLLAEMRIPELVTVMERFLVSKHRDPSSETWYFFMAMKVHLRTGFCIKSFQACEMYYLLRGDDSLRAKHSEAALNFFAVMWLMCVRCGWWERAELWEDRMQKPRWSKTRQERFGVMHAVNLLEGRLVQLVEQMNNRNFKAITKLEKSIDELVLQIKSCSPKPSGSKPKINLLKAYNHLIHGQRRKALSWLDKSHQEAQLIGDLPLLAWTEHTRRHWLRTLDDTRVTYWLDHSEPPNHRTPDQFQQDPSVANYTLPVPIGVKMLSAV